MELPLEMRLYLVSLWLPLPTIVNLRATCTKEQDAAYATEIFTSYGFDNYTYHSVEDAESMMNTGICLRSFHIDLPDLPKGCH